MLGEKRSQELFGSGMRQTAIGNGQQTGMTEEKDSGSVRSAGDSGSNINKERKVDGIMPGGIREEDPDSSGIRRSGGTAEKENSAAHDLPSRSRIPTATVGVTNVQAHAAPMEPPAVWDVEEEDEAVRFQQGGTALRTHDLFFSPQDDTRDFSSVLQEVQEYISGKYSTLIMEEGGEDAREQIKRYITKYVQDYRIAVKGMSGQELVDTIYTEMAEFSFLTKYVFGTGIEEIDINSWKDIEIQYAGGETKKLEERFESPQHAINVVRRMLHTSGMVLDNASPAVLGHLSKNIRIAAMKTPLVDEDIGVAASIRIVNPQSMQAADFVKGGTATAEMLDFLTECVRYGISVCVAGATSSGKTTLMGWLLTTIPDKKRIYTIESGSRELALVREKEGKVSNSVIHTLTRDSEV